MHLLLWVNVVLDLICTVFARLWGEKKSKWKIHVSSGIRTHARTPLLVVEVDFTKIKTIINVVNLEFIGVLRLMQRYFSHICNGTDVQADWRSMTYGRAPNAIDISQGSLTCPSYTEMGPPFLYGDSDTPLHLVAFYDTLWIRGTKFRLKPPASSRGNVGNGFHFAQKIFMK